MFRGSFVALVTPLFDSGEVDWRSLEKLVHWHIESGTNGIVAVGTTGESATLSFEEHIQVVERTVQYAQGHIPVIAGSGANSTAEAIFLTKAMSKLSVDGFLSVVPYYNKPQQRGLVAHFEAIASSSDLPTMLYNVPSRTILDMNTETVEILSKHPNIVGIKDATGDLTRLSEVKQVVDSEFLFFSGDDESSCDFLCQGGDGVISVSANIAPAEMAQICQLAHEGKHAQAKEIDARLGKLHTELFVEPNPVMPKWALYKMGRMASAQLRLPLVLPELNSQKLIEERLNYLGLIK